MMGWLAPSTLVVRSHRHHRTNPVRVVGKREKRHACHQEQQSLSGWRLCEPEEYQQKQGSRLSRARAVERVRASTLPGPQPDSERPPLSSID